MFHVMLTDSIFLTLEIEEEEIRAIDATLTLARYSNEEEMIEVLKDADGLINHFAPMTRRVLERLPKCRVISRCGVGVDNVDVAAATELGIMVANVRDYCIDEASNHTIALLMACARKLFPLNQAVKSGVWKPTMPRPIHDFRVQTLGIVGYGKIGRATARKAQAFGLTVIVYDPRIKPLDPGMRFVSFDELLAESDYICIHASLTDRTRGLFSDETFDRMKPTAYLINSARGPIVDEAALYRALSQGKIAGAALDTMVKEPPDPENPLFACENLIVTPHVAWYSEESIDLLRRENTRAVIDVLKGGCPKFLVNPEVLKVLEKKRK
jgi:D-3-phosphoglycerate dehydrogenase